MTPDSVIISKLLQLKSMLAAATFETKLRQLTYALKYDPNQPRVPAGSPEGGQWTSGGGSTVGAVFADAGQVLSDAEPDPIRAGAQYAQVNNAPTGFSTIDETTDSLLKTLTQVSNSLPSGIGPMYGIAVHVEFAASLRMQDLRGISVEQSFNAGSVVRYGLDDSIRTDVVLRNDQGDIITIYDVKTNTATIRPSRAEELRAQTGAARNVPVIEVHVRRGATRKHEEVEEIFPMLSRVMETCDVDGNSRSFQRETGFDCRLATGDRR